jgi:hypothetical protein
MADGRYSFRITDNELAEKMEANLERTRVPLTTYLRDLLDQDLNGKSPPASSKDDRVFEKLVEEFAPGYSGKLDSLDLEIDQREFVSQLVIAACKALKNDQQPPFTLISDNHLFLASFDVANQASPRGTSAEKVIELSKRVKEIITPKPRIGSEDLLMVAEEGNRPSPPGPKSPAYKGSKAPKKKRLS